MLRLDHVAVVIVREAGVQAVAGLGRAAVADAVDGLMQKGLVKQMPLKDSVAAVSVGMVEGRAVLDLDYPEDSGCDADMNVVMTGAGRYVEVQGTAEGHTFDRDELNALLALAEKGIAELAVLQHETRKA